MFSFPSTVISFRFRTALEGPCRLPENDLPGGENPDVLRTLDLQSHVGPKIRRRAPGELRIATRPHRFPFDVEGEDVPEIARVFRDQAFSV